MTTSSIAVRTRKTTDYGPSTVFFFDFVRETKLAISHIKWLIQTRCDFKFADESYYLLTDSGEASPISSHAIVNSE